MKVKSNHCMIVRRCKETIVTIGEYRRLYFHSRFGVQSPFGICTSQVSWPSTFSTKKPCWSAVGKTFWHETRKSATFWCLMSEVSTIYRRWQERMQLELRDLSRLTRFASPRTRWVGNQRWLALCRSVSNCVCMYLHVFAVSVQYISRILTSSCPWIYIAKIGLWQAAAQRIGSEPLRFNENSWSHLRLPRSPVCWHNFVLAMAILCMWKVGHMSCRSAPCRAWQNSKRLCSSCSIWLSSDPRTVHFVSICTIVRICWNVVGLHNMDAVSLPRHHFGKSSDSSDLKSKQFLHVRTFMATDSLGDSKI